MAKLKRRASSAPAPTKATDAKTGAPFVRKFMLKLFDREDGQAANWPLIAETLFLEAFHAVDQLPQNDRVRSILSRVHDGSYARMTAEPADPQKQQDHAAAPQAGYDSPQMHFGDRPTAP
jgi:hypothetical protein